MIDKEAFRQVKVKINKLGLIRDSEIILNRMMVFIGESGLGKSYVALLSNYLFELMMSIDRMNQFFVNSNRTFNEIKDKFTSQSGTVFIITKSELIDWINKDAVDYLRYMLNANQMDADVEFEMPFLHDITFTYSRQAEGKTDNTASILVVSIDNTLSYSIRYDLEAQNEETCFSILLRFYLVQLLFGNFRNLRQNYILPPSRGTVMTEKIEANTGLYKTFVEDFKQIEVASPHPENVSVELSKEVAKILNGTVSWKSNTYYYNSVSGEEIPVSAAAASVRELAPLTMFINRYDISVSSILMEEPEAHLHSDKQRMMGDIMSLMISNGSIIQITTHSENLLQRLQELSQLGYLKDHYNSERFARICKEVGVSTETVLLPSVVSGYCLRQNENNTVRIESFNVMLDTLNILIEAQRKSIMTIETLNNYVGNILKGNKHE